MPTTVEWISIVLGVIGLIVGIIGIGYGFYQNYTKKTVERLFYLQAWEVYQSSQQALGWLLNTNAETDQIKKDLLFQNSLSRADSLYSKTIQNLYTHHKKVTPELIESWISEGRIKDEQRADFLRLIGENNEA